jgi:hypothetical protein
VRRLLLIALVVAGLLAVAAQVSWKLALALLGVVAVAGGLYLRSLARSVSDGMRMSKAGILRLATVQVHQVKPAPAEGGVPRYEIELTLTPRPGLSQARPWEPNHLRLSGARGVDLVRVSVREGNAFAAASGKVVTGAQRLRLLAEWPGQIKRLTLRYYETDVCEVPVKR